ncbi:MAG: metallophosphoesterase [Oscillochloris sp.]|nr:metallophosphoesterase [Oscillochloris sp.]
MRIVAISDTHGLHRQIKIPDGDLLIHAGDLTRHGTMVELADVAEWLKSLPHRYKLVIAGNHDQCLQDDPVAVELLQSTGATYLHDQLVVIAGLRIYGSPWQPIFRNMAFNLPRGAALRAIWRRVPAMLDVLITHTPPQNIRDRTFLGMCVGCADLAEELPRIRPRVHIFGHIHEAVGITTERDTIFANASAIDLLRRPVNMPFEIDLQLQKT